MLPGARRRRLDTAALRFVELPVHDLPGGLRVVRASTWVARRDGLAGLPDLPADVGLWIAPCRSIHTLGMRFPLDLVWLDRNDAVRAVTDDVGPRRQRTDLKARSVIEVRAGRGAAFASAWEARQKVQ